MHNLSHIHIRNFRSCADVAVPLAAYCPLVGQNNCGKSTIIASIDWLLRPYALVVGDFGDPTMEVVVEGTVGGLTEVHLGQLTPEHRQRIEPFCAGGSLRIRRTQASPGGGIRGITLEVRDPEIGGEEDAAAWKRNPTGIDAAIHALFPEPIHIAAMQDAAADVTSGKKDSTIGKLIAALIGKLEAAHGTHISNAFAEVRERLSADGSSRAPELEAFDAGANANLEDLFPGLQVRLHFEPPTVLDLLKAGTIKVFEGEQKHERSVEYLGHGAQRAIQMALIRYLADLARDAAGSTCTLLLIDEPELYLHPYAIEQVRLALRKLSLGGFQVIFSSHSPLLIGLGDVPNTVMVHRPASSGTRVRKRIADAWEDALSEAPSQSRRLFEFGTASKVLFASRVVIAEGDTEQQIIPVLYELMRGRPMMAAGIALINTGGSGGTAKCMRLLNALDIPCLAIVDLDYAFRQATRSGVLSHDDSDVAAVRLLVDEVKDVYGFQVESDGFPKKGNGYSAAEAFSCVAKESKARPHIAALASRLKDAGLWLWERGAIEEHLGLDGKKEAVWAEYAEKLRSTPIADAVPDFVGVSALLAWMESAVPAPVQA